MISYEQLRTLLIRRVNGGSWVCYIKPSVLYYGGQNREQCKLELWNLYLAIEDAMYCWPVQLCRPTTLNSRLCRSLKNWRVRVLPSWSLKHGIRESSSMRSWRWRTCFLSEYSLLWSWSFWISWEKGMRHVALYTWGNKHFKPSALCKACSAGVCIYCHWTIMERKL